MKLKEILLKKLKKNSKFSTKGNSIKVYFNSHKKNNFYSEEIDTKLLRFDTSDRNVINGLINSIDDFKFDYFVSTDLNLIDAIRIFNKNVKVISSVFELKKSEIKNSKFLIFFHTDDLYIDNVKEVFSNNGKLSIFKIFSIKHFGEFKFIWSSSNALLAINQRLKLDESLDNLWEKSNYYKTKTFKELGRHQDIMQCISMTNDLQGSYVEVGVLAGSSLLTAINYLKRTNPIRMSYGLDTFEGFNYDKAKNSFVGHWRNTHKLGNHIQVIEKIKLVLNSVKQKYKLIRCDICEDELPTEISKIAVGYIDLDMFEPTRDALIKISPKIVKNGVIICEDPVSTPGLIETYIALKMFLETEEGSKYSVLTLSSVYVLIKNK